MSRHFALRSSKPVRPDRITLAGSNSAQCGYYGMFSRLPLLAGVIGADRANEVVIITGTGDDHLRPGRACVPMKGGGPQYDLWPDNRTVADHRTETCSVRSAFTSSSRARM
ncbi:hypothetical protein [Nocardia sp. CA-145437]|uniref:hypothetical protein n=1 Tax=Nocardia sp. CA-145437 TaxID=3239980 RepID=UPI003D953105